MSEKIILVNERDEIIGYEDKYKAHEKPAMLHRAISVFLFSKDLDGNLLTLMQKRSDHKIVGPKDWSNTVCGNVNKGESYLDCAHRRLDQELGLKNIVLEELVKIRYKVDCNEIYSENEIDQFYVGYYNNLPTNFNTKEVSAVRFEPFLPLLNQNYNKNSYSPWFNAFMQHSKVSKSFYTFLNLAK